MTKDIIVLNGIIIFYLLQRLSEMLISKNNEDWLIENHNAREVNPLESLQMKVFHGLWFVSLLVEANLKHQFQAWPVALFIYAVLLCCLGIRLHTMEKLKRFWTIKIFSMNNHELSTDGLYRYLRHPNYLVVIIELLLIPFLLKAYFTMIIFSFLNIFIQARRIKLEEETLMNQTNYAQLFNKKNRIIPFILTLALSWSVCLKAEDSSFQFNNYKEAKKADNFIKFESTSTKLGFITTSFDGYARSFTISYDLRSDKLGQLEVTLPVAQLDTDSDGRNEKMLQEIMEADKFPSIIGKIKEPLNLSEGEHTINMAFHIKDKKFDRPVKFTVRKDHGNILINGTTTMGLKEIGLPDPSIAIAKVRDLFDIKFAVSIPSK